MKVFAKFGVSSEGSIEEESASYLNHMVVGGIGFLTVGSECLSSSLAIELRFPSIPCHVGLSHTTVGFIKVRSLGWQERETEIARK